MTMIERKNRGIAPVILILIIALVVVVGIGTFYYTQSRQALPSPSGGGGDSGIEGSVFLGPICPVKRIPPDPKCADKPYAATIIVKDSTNQAEITQFTSDASGHFKVALAPGSYWLDPVGGTMPPIGRSLQVTVSPH